MAAHTRTPMKQVPDSADFVHASSAPDITICQKNHAIPLSHLSSVLFQAMFATNKEVSLGLEGMFIAFVGAQEELAPNCRSQVRTYLCRWLSTYGTGSQQNRFHSEARSCRQTRSPDALHPLTLCNCDCKYFTTACCCGLKQCIIKGSN